VKEVEAEEQGVRGSSSSRSVVSLHGFAAVAAWLIRTECLLHEELCRRACSSCCCWLQSAHCSCAGDVQ
jgi:hypothetical protein